MLYLKNVILKTSWKELPMPRLYFAKFYSKSFRHTNVQDNQNNLIRETIAKDCSNSLNDWKMLREKLLSSNNKKMQAVNIDSKIIGHCLTNLQIKTAKSYIAFLQHEGINLNLATLGNLLRLYYLTALNRALSEEEMQEIKILYCQITKISPTLDANTMEHLLHAICVTDQWKDALKYLENIKITATPSSSTFSAVIIAAFNNNEKELAVNLLNQTISHNRIPNCNAFISWINYCDRFHDKCLLNIRSFLKFIEEHEIIVSIKVGNEIKKFFEDKGYVCTYTSLKKSGICPVCKSKMQSISLAQDDFDKLQNAIMDKIIIRNDVFLKSSPNEVETFIKFLSKTAPYDIVIDGLNVAFSNGSNKQNIVFAKLLSSVIKYFADMGKTILVLGRIHMNKWPKEELSYIKKNANIFLTDNLSQDDPFLLYATIKSGPEADFFSRDLMRSHSFLLGNELKPIFRKWQQEHQYSLIHANDFGNIIIKQPIKFKTCAHETSSNIWHIPCQDNNSNPSEQFFISNRWLCISENKIVI